MSEKPKKLRRALIIPDCHVPYEDKRSYELMLRVAKETKIDEVVILGDFVDFYDVSSHPRDPEVTESSLVNEIECAHARLMELNELFPKAKKVYICGNHEYRLDRYIQNNASALFGFVSIKNILKLDDLGWEFIPYGRYQKYQVLGSRLYARHEPIGGGEHAAASTVKKAVASVVFGHTHRVQEFQMRGLNGDLHRGISLGCLIKMEHPVFNYIKNHEQWCHAFGIADVLPDGQFFHHIVHIINHRCTFNGKVYEN